MGTKRKSPVVELLTNGVPLPPPAVPFHASWPSLAWHLEACRWGDGKGEREPGAISIFPQDGLVKAALRERNVGQVTFLSGKSVDDLLCRLEKALAEHTVHWREDRYAQQRKLGS